MIIADFWLQLPQSVGIKPDILVASANGPYYYH